MQEILLWAFKNNVVLVIDEFNLHEDLFTLTNHLLTGRVPGNVEVINTDFFVFATQNPAFEYEGRCLIPRDNMNRMSYHCIQSFNKTQLLDMTEQALSSRYSQQEKEQLVDDYRSHAAQDSRVNGRSFFHCLSRLNEDVNLPTSAKVAEFHTRVKWVESALDPDEKLVGFVSVHPPYATTVAPPGPFTVCATRVAVVPSAEPAALAAVASAPLNLADEKRDLEKLKGKVELAVAHYTKTLFFKPRANARLESLGQVRNIAKNDYDSVTVSLQKLKNKIIEELNNTRKHHKKTFHLFAFFGMKPKKSRLERLLEQVYSDDLSCDQFRQQLGR
jgi:hypothetical protein